ncbi:putative gpi anchored protein [Botrytis fragariae]|uniref:Putative gpi anchored protein n=1 Tax=Botrytis fragariae TaxID=1964551 RepID=A0A8H6EG27_9HELO|nr:putative gpi anchored protein [Botrytis fragariae]KAF5870615.1 putative gpi anchored protein [Botrytis fragariae]
MLFRYESLASLLACVQAVAALYSSDVEISQRDFSSRQMTSLGAITVRSAEQKRGVANFKPNLECTHHYADHDSIIRGTHSRFASTSLKYKLPAVTLEDIELNVKNILCSKSTIIVEFPSANLLAEAENEWKDLSKFLVISSHTGCNVQNARAPYLVSNVEYAHKSNTAILSVQRIEWSDAYDTMEVKFGMGKYDSSALRIHSDLRKRITSSVSVSSSETVSFPSAPSATPTSDTSVQDIGYSVPAGFNLGSFATSNDGAGGSLSINCGNCSIEGSIELIQGVFNVSDSSLDTEKAVNFVEHGYFDMVFNGLGAHIEIDSAVAGTFTETFTMELTTLALPGFQIPDIAAIGPMWIPAIQGSISVSRNLNFTYGFDVSVPDKSSMRLNIGNLTESTSSGFSDSAITALPLIATDPSISLTLSLALHSEILLGVNILSGKGSIAAGAFLDLPALSVTISELTSVDENCNPAQSSSSSVKDLDYFSSLTNIVPQADIAIGLQAGIQLRIPDLHFVENVGTTATLAGTSMLLPTHCMSFDGGKKEFVTPGATGSSSSSLSTSTGTAGSSKKSNAEKMISVPVVGGEGFGGLTWMAGLLGCSHDYEKLDFSENLFEKLPRELLLPIVKLTSDLASAWSLSSVSSAVYYLIDGFGKEIVETFLEASEPEKLQIIFGHIVLLRLGEHPSKSMDEFKDRQRFSALNKIGRPFTAQTPANHTFMDNNNRAFKSKYELLPEEVSSVIIRAVLRTAYNISQLTYICHKHFLDRCESFEFSEPIHLRSSRPGSFLEVKLSEYRKYSVRNVTFPLPSWIEQKRITQTFWYIQMFYDLKNNSQNLRWANPDLDRLKSMNVKSFHNNPGCKALENAILTAALYPRENSQRLSSESTNQSEFPTLRLPNQI